LDGGQLRPVQDWAHNDELSKTDHSDPGKQGSAYG
jgi:hypothetical protein